MLWLASLFFILGSGLLLANVIWMVRFNRLLLRGVFQPNKPHHDLRALVLLSLRGADPYLKKTLEKLASQTYQNFDLRIVIDHEYDDAAETVNDFLKLQDRPRTTVHVLRKRLSTCSLKVSALLQELTLLEPEYDVVVQIDADAVPYPDWLRDMLAPLADPRVGVVSGLRWYTPDQITTATLYRQIWGSSAMVQMHAFQMPWGGSMAMSRDFLERSDVFERWSNSLSDDLSITPALEEVGLRLEYVPAVLTNHEQADLSGFFEFIRRQLFMARWHHKNWPWVAGHATLMIIAILLGTLTTTIAFVEGHVWFGVGTLLVSLGFCVGFGQTMRWTERNIRRRLIQQGESAQPISFWYRFAMFPTGFLFLASFLSVIFTRKIFWRGVAYKMNSDGQAILLRDHLERPAQKTRTRQKSYIA